MVNEQDDKINVHKSFYNFRNQNILWFMSLTKMYLRKRNSEVNEVLAYFRHRVCVLIFLRYLMLFQTIATSYQSVNEYILWAVVVKD